MNVDVAKEFTWDEYDVPNGDGGQLWQFWDEDTRTQYRMLKYPYRLQFAVRYNELPVEEGMIPPHAGGMGPWNMLLDIATSYVAIDEAKTMADMERLAREHLRGRDMEQAFYSIDVGTNEVA